MKKSFIVLIVALGIGATLLSLPRSAPEDAAKARTIRAHLRNLAHPDYELRYEAQAALSDVGPAAAPFLIKTLEDRPRALELLVVNVSRRLGLATVELSTTPQLRAHAAEQLAAVCAHDPVAPRALVSALGEPQSLVTTEAQRSLRRVGPRVALPELRRALSSRNAHSRRHAAEVLRDFGPAASSATPDLLALLRDRNASVRLQAASSLAAVAGNAAVPPLMKALDDRHPSVRAAAAEALAQIGPSADAAFPALNRCLRDDHPRVRIAAARALWMVRRDASGAVPVLIAALDAPAGWEAALVLAAIGPSASNAVPALVERLKRERVPRPLRETPVSALALGQIGSASVPALIAVLQHSEPRARTSAALALGHVGVQAASATPHLVKLLNDPDGDVRRAATLSLGTIDPSRKELVSALLLMAGDEDIFLSSLAASTLERIDPQAAASVRRE